jgi:hypothetical protein
LAGPYASKSIVKKDPAGAATRGAVSLGCSRQLFAEVVSFDHLVGATEQQQRHSHAKLLGRHLIDAQLPRIPGLPAS